MMHSEHSGRKRPHTKIEGDDQTEMEPFEAGERRAAWGAAGAL
jgi:hypothetical protein